METSSDYGGREEEQGAKVDGGYVRGTGIEKENESPKVVVMITDIVAKGPPRVLRYEESGRVVIAQDLDGPSNEDRG